MNEIEAIKTDTPASQINSHDYGALTHTGLTRENNEDAYLSSPELGVFIVADGVGGLERGEVAARIAKETIHSYLLSGSDLEAAILAANEAILKHAQTKAQGETMATTIVVSRITGLKYQIAWLGDSRAYAWRSEAKTLEQLTTDHSYVQTLFEHGAISAEDMANHPQRNIITQSLGAKPSAELQVGMVSGELDSQDLILLCSDGLTDLVSDADISQTLTRSGLELEKTSKRLLQQALDGGGTDNVTVSLIRLKGKKASGLAKFMPWLK